MAEGQFSGVRKVYEYEADTGDKYLITLDATLGDLAGVGLTAATTATTATALPKRLTPRVVFWQGELGGRTVRKSLVCDAASDLYTGLSQAVTIDGVVGTTTGRRGEKLTFARLPAPST